MNLEGRVLGNRYEIIEKVGNGGMATVYRATDLVLKRYVAVKILRDEFTTDEEFIKRFETDIKHDTLADNIYYNVDSKNYVETPINGEKILFDVEVIK